MHKAGANEIGANTPNERRMEEWCNRGGAWQRAQSVSLNRDAR